MIEAVSGMRLGQFIGQNIAVPLGMGSTAFKITPDMRARLAKVHQRNADGTFNVTAIEVPQEPEFDPGGGGIYGLNAVLVEDGEPLWERFFGLFY